MANVYESTYSFEIEKSIKTDQKKLMLMADNELITLNIRFKEKKIEDLKKFIKEKYTHTKKVIKTNVLLDNLNTDYLYDSNNSNYKFRILNERIETKKEKIGMFKSKEYTTTYGDVEYTYYSEPDALKLVRNIFNRNYINLVGIYNYILSCKGLDIKNRKVTIGINDKFIFTKNRDLPFYPNEEELKMTDEQLKSIVTKIFDCFIIESVDKKIIQNNKIGIDINSSVEELLTLKASLIIAKLNSEVLASDLLNIKENEINKEFKIKKTFN